MEEVCMNVATTLYRFDAARFEDGLRILLLEYSVLKSTPCGFWIQYYPRKWVSGHSKKRFAYPTIEEAKVGFIKRKERQIAILKSRLDEAERALAMIQTEQTFSPDLSGFTLP